MSTPEAIRELEEMGYSFKLTDNGQIGAIGRPGSDAHFLLDIIKADHDGAVEYLQRYSLFDAIAIGEAVKSGKAALTGKVIYHRREDNVTVPWEPIQGSLAEYRETLQTKLEQRLHRLETCNLDGLSTEAVEQLAEEYGICRRLLNCSSSYE